MAEHPSTLIDIESYRQDNDSTLYIRTESQKCIAVTQHKNIILFYHQTTQLLHRIFQKHNPIKKIIPKIINLFNIFTKIINNLKNTT